MQRTLSSGVSAYLDTAHPEPVICSSNFQTHKRFKIAMLPATTDGVANGAESTEPIDLVFNVADGGRSGPIRCSARSTTTRTSVSRATRSWLAEDLEGRTGFQSASTLGIADKLHISIGIGEGATGEHVLDGTDIFDADDGLATFSHGLFGPPSTEHPEAFPTDGFFDGRYSRRST